MGRISPGPTRWPPGAERRLVPAKSNLKPQTYFHIESCYSSLHLSLSFNPVANLQPQKLRGNWSAAFARLKYFFDFCIIEYLLQYLVHLPPHGGLLIGGPGNGAPPPSKSSPYAIIYDSRAETKHTSKVYDAAPLNDRLGELICAVIFVLINHGCFAKLGPLQGFNFFSSITNSI